jgi:hypothetical protein
MNPTTERSHPAKDADMCEVCQAVGEMKETNGQSRPNTQGVAASEDWFPL